jgi:glycerol uptake facilitator-like aquaporin
LSFSGFIGTFWLVLVGCGTAVLAAAFPHVGVGLLGVALAFGLTLLTMAYAIGHISGCHINPGVTAGLAAGGRFPARDVIPYIAVQVLGGILASSVLYMIASGAAGFSLSAGFAANGYGAHSPGGYPLLSCVVCEITMTAIFLFVIMGPPTLTDSEMRAARLITQLLIVAAYSKSKILDFPVVGPTFIAAGIVHYADPRIAQNLQFASRESVSADGTLAGCGGISDNGPASPDQTFNLSTLGFVPPFTLSVSEVK